MRSPYFLLLLFAARSLLAEPQFLSLEQSIGLAVFGATPILKAQNNDAQAAASLIQGYAQFLPNLVGRGSYSYQSGNVFTLAAAPTVVNTENYGPSYNISSTLNIFNGLSDFAALKVAIANKHAAALTLKRAKQQIALDVAQSYLQVILDNKIVTIASKTLDSSQARQKLLEEEALLGSANPADLARQEAQTSSDASFLINAKNKVQVDLLQLLTKLRLDQKADYELLEPKLDNNASPDPKYEDVNALINIALYERADLGAAQKSAESADFGTWVARSELLPKLDFQADLFSNARYASKQIVNGQNALPASQEPLGSQLGDHNYWVLSANLTWNIFDRWVTPANMAHANAAARNAAIDATDARNQVIADVKQAVFNYQSALAQLQATKLGLDAAQKAYDLVEGRYEAGLSSFIDVLTSQAALAAAQSSRAQAVIGFDLQTRALKTALGE